MVFEVVDFPIDDRIGGIPGQQFLKRDDHAMLRGVAELVEKGLGVLPNTIHKAIRAWRLKKNANTHPSQRRKKHTPTRRTRHPVDQRPLGP